jgi:hypothetical protein
VGWFRRSASKPPLSLGEQLEVLASCGVRLAVGVDPAALTISFEPALFEADPFRLALTVMGSEAEDERQAGPSGFPSDDIWHFDTECIENDGDYARIAARMATLANGGLPFESIRDRVDVEGGAAWLEFTLDGARHHWDAHVEDDWVDTKMLGRIAALQTRRSGGRRRFTYIDLGGQDCLIGCSTSEERTMLRERTGLKVDWLD